MQVHKIAAFFGWQVTLQKCMAEFPAGLANWQSGALGRNVLTAESQLLAAVMDDVFGLELLQLGVWGAGRELLRGSRIRRQSVVASALPPEGGADIIASPAFLPVPGGSIDAVLLPHCLEIEPDPYAVLREADRVLIGEGHLLILGFRPWSLWGLRATASRTGFPPGFNRLISEQRLRDWLVLLGYEITAARHYLYVTPSEARARSSPTGRGTLRRGLFNPLPPGAYLLKARKRIYALTPLRPRRRVRARLLAGIAKPVYDP
jgi:SAM-dependent methyltransferase